MAAKVSRLVGPRWKCDRWYTNGSNHTADIGYPVKSCFWAGHHILSIELHNATDWSTKTYPPPTLQQGLTKRQIQKWKQQCALWQTRDWDLVVGVAGYSCVRCKKGTSLECGTSNRIVGMVKIRWICTGTLPKSVGITSRFEYLQSIVLHFESSSFFQFLATVQGFPRAKSTVVMMQRQGRSLQTLKGSMKENSVSIKKD